MILGRRGTGKSNAPRSPRPGLRGWSGPGSGRAAYIEPTVDWRGSTAQVCGLWPFAAGAGTPMIGVPLGRSLASGATVCCDPISWFERAQLISQASAFVLARPGLGKSTLVRRWLMGLTGYGVMPLVLGDLKPDYVDLIRALGGQVITLAPGRDRLNVLDATEALEAAKLLQGKARTNLLADAAARRKAMVSALITIVRHNPPSDGEDIVLERAIRLLDEQPGVPVLHDLLKVVQAAPSELREVVIDRGDLEEYQRATHALERTLTALAHGSRIGQLFSEPTTTRMELDRPVVFDVSAVGEDERDLQAAVLMASWSYGFGMVNVANALADARIAPQRHYMVVMDELWRALGAGAGMVDRANALVRLNRSHGVGQIMVSHSMTDMLALPTEEERQKAAGFVEKAAMLVCGGLPQAEMPLLSGVAQFTEAERNIVTGWVTPGGWNANSAPPGQGKFLIKVGDRPGIPLQVALTQAELALSDTNKRWEKLTRQHNAVGPHEEALA